MTDVAQAVGDQGRTAAQQLLSELCDGGKIGDRGLWALRAAADAARTDGIVGAIIVKIPSTPKDFIDITFTNGAFDVVARWGG